MFAVVKTGGKQYKVQVGSVIKVERLKEEIDQELILEDVIFSSDHFGSPDVPQVRAKVLNQFKDKKVIVFKKKRRKNYRRKNGHRQFLTTLQILSIS